MPKIKGLDERLIKSTMHQAHIPGVSIAFVDGKGSLTTTTIGKTDKHVIPPESSVSRDTVFGAASLSKPVFAYLVLKLIDKGILSRPGETAASGLDRPLQEVLPLEKFFREHGKRLSKVDSERAKAITPRMLLSHSSGLGIDDSSKLSFKPGTEYAYSGIGLVYLQKVIEKITGQSLEKLAQREVFQPLGMSNSSFLPPEKPHYMAHTISSRAKSIEIPNMPNAANSVYTTASDYAKLMKAWMHDPSPVMQQAFIPQIFLTRDKQILPGENEPATKDVPEEDKARLAWGCGLGLELDEAQRPVKAFHTGDMNQYRSQVALSLQDKSCIVYLANGRDHREANGHVLGPLIITPKIPLPHAHKWFYEKFRFASNVDELIGGPHFGLRVPRPDNKPGVGGAATTTSSDFSEFKQRAQEQRQQRKPAENTKLDQKRDESELKETPLLAPFKIKPKSPGDL